MIVVVVVVAVAVVVVVVVIVLVVVVVVIVVIVLAAAVIGVEDSLDTRSSRPLPPLPSRRPSSASERVEIL